MPDEYLIDGGFVTHENIEVVTARGATLYAPPAKSRKPKIDPCEPREDEPPAAGKPDIFTVPERAAPPSGAGSRRCSPLASAHFHS